MYKFFLLRAKLWLGSISLMDRYIFGELIPPFLLSVGLVSSLGVAIGYLSDLINKVVESNLPLILAIQILFLKVPEFIAYALPVSVLLSTLMTYGRLSSDSELIALRSCGISFYRIMAPAMILSFMVTGLTFFFNELAVPTANYRATSILVDSIQEEHDFWQNKDIFYPDYEEITLPNGETKRRLKNLFYAEKFDGKNMRQLLTLGWRDGRLDRIIFADSATWNSPDNAWDFFNGTIYQLGSDYSYQKTVTFTHQQIHFTKVPFELASQGRNPYEMNIAQAWQYMKLLKLSGDRKNLVFFRVRTQQKIAFPFICLVFGLVGSVLGSQPQKMGRATSFGICVAIVFSYYLLAFLMGSLGMAGVLSPFMAAWLPNFLTLGLGILLSIQAAR